MLPFFLGLNGLRAIAQFYPGDDYTAILKGDLYPKTTRENPTYTTDSGFLKFAIA